MSQRRKRVASPAQSAKRQKASISEVIDLTIDDSEPEDEDISDILAQIDATEKLREIEQAAGSSFQPSESDEALAHRLAAEWNAEPEAAIASGSHSQTHDEDDEALAHRLAAEWNKDQSPSWEDAAAGSPRDGNVTQSDDSEPLSKYRPLFIGSRPCSKCGKNITPSRGTVLFTSSDMTTLPRTLTYFLHAPCPSCATNHCRGCFKPVECPSTCKGLAKNGTCTVHLCCAEVRAIALFELLAAFDKIHIAENASSQTRAKTSLHNGNRPSKSVGPGGTGYGQDDHRVYERYGDLRNARAASSVDAGHQTEWDKTLVNVLNLVTKFLPAPYADDAHSFDYLPHTSIGGLLLMSQLPDLLATLLRNDSISDWTARSSVYYAMLSLLRRMGDCELTIRVLLESRKERTYSPGLESWMLGEEDMTWAKSKSGEIEMAPPLYDYFKKLTTQSKAFTGGAASMTEGDDDVLDSIVAGTSLCGDIIAASESMERAISMLEIPLGGESQDEVPSKGKGKGRDLVIDLERQYTKAWERLAFQHVELGDADSILRFTQAHRGRYASHNFAAMAAQTQQGTRNPKDRIHLIKEQAVMSTSLPPGIWVRVDEVRQDILKILIAGPDGTPYADGLFEFDCFMPLNYPQVPPQMHLRTTGGGTVGFNPNLYADGKVCLSLLGTWAGRPEEQWQPYKSTLLQVLVSIQSMILIDLPYFNEPGRGQAKKSKASTQFNQDLTCHTTRWAIVDWLKEEHRKGIWADVIASHFMIRKDAIRNRIIQWGRDNARIHNYYGMNARGVFGGRRGGGVSVPRGGGLDLLAEFDRGLAVIEKWPRSE